ncbi:TAXI family TRAP transporter solute-binding subunit [Halioglobus maricola]|uniref:TAXI family TRAP transporter solute-binding subunit n=1 Tax=Halioglobus maricola TaxID=2601894 RepID=UPI001479809C|nr:TAXI family TRAP transporter solute-binding subunit [Halioglobus maricola]
MQLLSPRLRIFLIVIVWLIALSALVIWLGTSREHRLAIAGGPAGSETLALTQAIAEVLNEKNLGFRLIVFESGGSTQNVKFLSEGRVSFATIQGDARVSDEVTAVAVLYQDAYHLIASEDSGITAFQELAGHRIAVPPTSSGQFSSFHFLARHYGIAGEIPDALPMSEEAANFAMEQGQVDAVFRVRAPGNDSIRELIGEKRLRLVEIGQSEALSLKQPAISPGIIPRGSYRGSPPLPTEHLDTAVVNRLLVTRSDLDQHLVYQVTRAIFQNRSEILEHSLLAGFIGPIADESSSVITTHPGARSWYDREKPGIMQQNARLVSALLYVVAILSSALLALRTHWVRSRRMRMHDFNKELMALASTVRSDKDIEALIAHKNRLMDILEQVVSDLERERVSPDEFEQFSFTWQAVDALVRDRLLLFGVVEQTPRAET